MLAKLAPGDVVTVTRIDRLARSTFDLFGIVKRIADAKAQFRSPAEPWADTGTSTGRLMLAVLGGLADVERDLIRTRTAEGRSRAKAKGKHMGRPSSLTGTAERGHQTARGGRYIAGIGRQLRPQHIHHAPGDTRHLKGRCPRPAHLPQWRNMRLGCRFVPRHITHAVPPPQPPGRGNQSFSRVSLLIGGTVVPRGIACFSPPFMTNGTFPGVMISAIPRKIELATPGAGLSDCTSTQEMIVTPLSGK